MQKHWTWWIYLESTIVYHFQIYVITFFWSISNALFTFDPCKTNFLPIRILTVSTISNKHAHMPAHMHKHACMHTCTCPCTQAQTCTHACAYVHAHVHVHTHFIFQIEYGLWYVYGLKYMSGIVGNGKSEIIYT